MKSKTLIRIQHHYSLNGNIFSQDLQTQILKAGGIDLSGASIGGDILAPPVRKKSKREKMELPLFFLKSTSYSWLALWFLIFPGFVSALYLVWPVMSGRKKKISFHAFWEQELQTRVHLPHINHTDNPCLATVHSYAADGKVTLQLIITFITFTGMLSKEKFK